MISCSWGLLWLIGKSGNLGFNPLLDMPISDSSSSAATKDMIAKI